jgi:hypothetical protein
MLLTPLHVKGKSEPRLPCALGTAGAYSLPGLLSVKQKNNDLICLYIVIRGTMKEDA